MSCEDYDILEWSLLYASVLDDEAQLGSGLLVLKTEAIPSLPFTIDQHS
jgi:hypothetical protein